MPLNAVALKALKSTDHAKYLAELAEIEARAVRAPSRPQPNPQPASQDRATPRAAYSRGDFTSLVEMIRRGLDQDDATSGPAVTGLYRRANAVYACIRLRSGMISSLPLVAYKLGTDGGSGRVVDVRQPHQRLGMPTRVRGKRVADAGAVTQVETGQLASLLARPNPDWTSRTLIQATESSLCLGGQSHWQLERGKDGRGVPFEMGIVKSDRMQVIKPGDDQAPSTSSSRVRSIAGWHKDRYTSGSDILTPDEVVWFRYVDPDDLDYGCVAPAEVAKLGADSYRDAMKSNRDIFRRGLTAGGMLLPAKDDGEFDEDQALDLESDLSKRLMGRENNHAIAVMRTRFELAPFSNITPHDAEFLGLLDFTIEDVGRAFGVPIEFIGGSRRTYQNLPESSVLIWMQTLEPEATFIAEELTAKLVPLFGGEADFVAFDLSNVSALQEDEAKRWAIARDAIRAGALTVNEWRKEEGLAPLPWGDSWWAPGALAPVATVTPDETSPESAPAPTPAEEPLRTSLRALLGRRNAEPDADRALVPAFDSDEHRAFMRARDETLADFERAIERVARELLKSQAESLSERLSASRVFSRIDVDDLRKAFNRPRWVREFREKMRPELAKAVRAGGDMLGGQFDFTFDPGAAPVVNFLRARAQRLAEEVNETTWEDLKDSVSEGITAGESMTDLAGRVTTVMADKIRSTPELIARTEAIGAYTGGSLEAARQSDLTLEKAWMSALDGKRVRETHQEAHGQTVGIDEDFEVGDATGPGPGLMGDPNEDCNCRCALTYGEASEAQRSAREARHAVFAAA